MRKALSWKLTGFSLAMVALVACSGDPSASETTSGGTGGSSTGSGGNTGGSGGSSAVPSECNDGIDNDGDGYTDWQSDLGCYGPGDTTEAARPRNEEDGFTTFAPGNDSLIVYVSNEGDDANDGLSPDKAVKTIARAANIVRDGEHDFILLRRGDVWRDESLGRFKSGRDADHRLVIASYGESMERPRLELSKEFIDHNGQARNHLALVGLYFINYAKDPSDAAFSEATTNQGGLRFVGGGDNILIEDCHFKYSELVAQSYGGFTYKNIEVRRSIIERSYHADTCTTGSTYRPSGIYSSHVEGMTIEENLLDHNGWNEDEVASACATIYNHNLYLNGHDIVIRGNLLARASSIQIKMRSDTTGDVSGLRIENNFLVEGEIGFSIGGNTDLPYRFKDTIVRGNVLTDLGRSQPTKRTLAWGIGIQDNDTAIVEDNLVLNHRTPGVSNSWGLTLGGVSAKNYQIKNNLFWRLQNKALQVDAIADNTAIAITDNEFVDPEFGALMVRHDDDFAGTTYSGNRYSTTAAAGAWFYVGPMKDVSIETWRNASGESDAKAIAVPNYPDPERDIESYTKVVGAGATLPDFLALARSQSRLNWRKDLMAAAVNDYIRAGFGR